MTQRLLRTLVADGYVSRVERGHYVLATRALMLGAELSRSHHLSRVARPYLLDLQYRIGETVNLAVLDGVDVVYVARFSTKRILSIQLDVGTRLPAYCTSLGRAILAFLPTDQATVILRHSNRQKYTSFTKASMPQLVKELALVAERGYAITSEELELGLRSTAVPIFGSGDSVLAAVNVSVPAARVSTSELERDLVPPLVEASQLLSRALGAGAR